MENRDKGLGGCVTGIVFYGLFVNVESKRCVHMEQRYCCVVCDMKKHLELQG